MVKWTKKILILCLQLIFFGQEPKYDGEEHGDKLNKILSSVKSHVLVPGAMVKWTIDPCSVLKKLIFLARSRSTMVKSMGELKKVVVSKVANNASENRGNKRKYILLFFSSLLNLYFVITAVARARVILF